jgi:DNA-binding beta-propeller fold protein YncE
MSPERVYRIAAGKEMARVLFVVGIMLAYAIACVPHATATQLGKSGAKGRERATLASLGIERYSEDPSGKRPYQACPPPTKSRASCQAIVVPPGAGKALRASRRASGLVDSGAAATLEGTGVDKAFSPEDLRSAYKLTEAGGKGVTVAITIAYDNPQAESDLAIYRSHYGLPPCTTANGCFKKVNQKGESKNYPANAFWVFGGEGWVLEGALDMQMVSAICPECKITLVEANDNGFENLGAAENTAASIGAVVSNSWAGLEHTGQLEEDSLYYNHPGVPLLFASGDEGYITEWPASAASVIAVGGTSLSKDESKRGWRERAWEGAGSGCSRFEEKPEWQTDKGCANRSLSDVSAVADSATPVSVYAEGFEQKGSTSPGWLRLGGTSVATPIMAAIEARLSAEERAEGASLFWRLGSEGKLFDVAEGHNGHCAPDVEYLCDGKVGYDGPTGWGTPGGSRPGPPVVGTYDPSAVDVEKATLKGAVNPNGKATTYRFEWGPSTEYGNLIPITEASAGSGAEAVQVSAQLSGLSRSTTYHYRLVATNSEGTVRGFDHSFVTSPWQSNFAPIESVAGTYVVKQENLSSVSCVAAVLIDPCVASGTDNVETGFFEGFSRPLVDRWDGSKWSNQSLVSQEEAEEGKGFFIVDTSCSSSTACMAIGLYGEELLAERWDGSKWSSVSAPIVPADAVTEPYTDVRLKNVSCVSSTSCVLVGEYVSARGKNNWVTEAKTLIESWDGSKWTVVSSPSFAGEWNALEGVSCVSANSCIAVGHRAEINLGTEVAQSARALAVSWNGSSWSVQTPPDVPSLGDYLLSVSCSSSSSCIAVGNTSNEEGLAETWNGSEWTIDSPERPLRAVSCAAAGRCIGVGGVPMEIGEEEIEITPAQAIVERWDGSKWVSDDPALPPDATGYEGMELYDVSCSPDVCSAVGWYGSPRQQALAFNMDPSMAFAAPEVSTEAATEATLSEATLNGSVNPQGYATSYYFEYGPTTSYGSSTASVSAGSGTSAVKVGTPVSGLAADSTYHFRIAVTSGGQTFYGKDAELATHASFSFAFGSEGTGNGQFKAPKGLALDPAGDLWVVDSTNNRVQKWTRSSAFSFAYGSEGTIVGRFKAPKGIARDSAGNFWVADSNNDRVQKFNAKGEYLTKLGSSGPGNGQLNTPRGIAIDAAGNIWVVDGANNRVQKFNAKGEYLSQFGSGGSGDGQFNSPNGIAIDPAGNIWVVDSLNYRVQKFNSSGEFLLKLGSAGSGNGQFGLGVAGIAADAAGNVWVADTGKSRLQKFNSNGEYLTQFGASGSGNGQLKTPNSIAIDRYGNLWVTDNGNDRVQKFNSSGEYLAKFGAEGSGEGQLKAPTGIAIDPAGSAWVVDGGNNRVQKWAEAAPTFSFAFGSEGTGNGQFKAPSWVAFDASGDLWVADTSNNRVQKFNAKGEYLSQFGSEGTGNGQFKSPNGIAITAAGDLWVVDSSNKRVQKFNAKGEYLSQFGGFGTGNGKFFTPKGIAIDASGNIWIADTGGNTLQKFNSSGEFLLKFGSSGTGNGQYFAPTGIAIDSAGSAWIADTNHHRVQRVNQSGEYLSQFGAEGSGNGQFKSPNGIAIDAYGSIWLADTNNNRVQKWR